MSASNGSATKTTFAELARAAIEKVVAEARAPQAVWGSKRNFAWVRWEAPEGRFALLGLRRHLNWVTGEIGLSRSVVDLDALPLLTEAGPGDLMGGEAGGRVRLGVLLEGEDRWWPAGKTEAELVERLEWLALQLRVRSQLLLSRPAPPGP